VMENLAVYRVRFDNAAAVASKTDQRATTREVNAAPVPAPSAAQQ